MVLLLALHSRHVKKTHGFFLTGRLATTFDFLYQFTAIRIYGRGENIPSTFEAYLEFNCFLSIKADEVELVQSQYTLSKREKRNTRAHNTKNWPMPPTANLQQTWTAFYRRFGSRTVTHSEIKFCIINENGLGLRV
jgi:hypothetical protein